MEAIQILFSGSQLFLPIVGHSLGSSPVGTCEKSVSWKVLRTYESSRHALIRLARPMKPTPCTLQCKCFLPISYRSVQALFLAGIRQPYRFGSGTENPSPVLWHIYLPQHYTSNQISFCLPHLFQVLVAFVPNRFIFITLRIGNIES